MGRALCEHCQAEFSPKNTRGRFGCSRCRSAAWQAQRRRELALALEELWRVAERLQRIPGRS